MLTFSLNYKLTDFKRVEWLENADDTLDIDATNILAKAGHVKKSHKYSKPSCYLDSQIGCLSYNNGVLKKLYTYIWDEGFIEPADDELLVGCDEQLVSLDNDMNTLDFLLLCDALFNDYGTDVLFLLNRFFRYRTDYSTEILVKSLHLDTLSDFHIGVLHDGLCDSSSLHKIIKNSDNTLLIDNLHREFNKLTNNAPTLKNHEELSLTKLYRERMLVHAKNIQIN